MINVSASLRLAGAMHGRPVAQSLQDSTDEIKARAKVKALEEGLTISDWANLENSVFEAIDKGVIFSDWWYVYHNCKAHDLVQTNLVMKKSVFKALEKGLSFSDWKFVWNNLKSQKLDQANFVLENSVFKALEKGLSFSD